MGRERCTSLLSWLASHLNPPPQAAVPLLLTRYLFSSAGEAWQKTAGSSADLSQMSSVVC